MSDHGDEPYEERPADDQEINGDLGKRSKTLSRKGFAIRCRRETRTNNYHSQTTSRSNEIRGGGR